MSYLDANRTPERIASAIAAAVIVAAAGYVAATAREGVVLKSAVEALSTFDVTAPPPPPPPPTPAPEPSKAKEGAASAANTRATPTQIVAPKPRLPIPVPVKAAPVAGKGNDSDAGAAETPGPGTGAGGSGNGLGSGNSGDGTGDGGLASKSYRIKGDISNRDFRNMPENLKVDGTVVALVRVGIDGRAKACSIVRSSGSARLDSETCDLIRQRFRYEPARNGAGDPIESDIYRTQRYCLKGQDCRI